MGPHSARIIGDDDEMRDNENQWPSSATAARASATEDTKQKGRILYCRKCEGHGEKVILKNHSPQCPYILCNCKSCEKLNYKRLKSFNKRNKEKIQLAAALNAKRHATESTSSVDEDEGTSRRSSFSSKTSTPGMEENTSSSGSPSGLAHGRSMSLGAMTVMSYDIWKAKCASEKKRRQQEEEEHERAKKVSGGSLGDTSDVAPISKRSTPSPTPMRKRAHTFVAHSMSSRSDEIPAIAPKKMSVDEKKGKYILLPTIPAMRIFVNEDDEGPATNAPPKTTAPSCSFPPIAKPAPLHPVAFKPIAAATQPPPISHQQHPIGNMSTEQIISSLTLHNTVLQQQQANQQVMHELLANLHQVNGAGNGVCAPPAPSAELLSMLRLQQQAATLAAALQAAGVQLPPTTTIPVTTSSICAPPPTQIIPPPPPILSLVSATPNLLSSLLPIYSNPV